MSTQRPGPTPAGSGASRSDGTAVRVGTPSTSVPRPPRRGGPGPMGNMGMPAEKAMQFVPSGKRLLGRLRPDRVLVAVVLLVGVVSVVLTVIGPKLLGQATNIVFAGVLSQSLPKGLSKNEVIAGLEAQGQTAHANLLKTLPIHPGYGIDFAALGALLLVVLALYVVASLFGYLQGYLVNIVTQRLVFRLRSDVEAKLHRLPLKSFDRMPRGELLSRVTNDIDNIQQSLQQSLSQAVNSVLTVVGIIVVMFLISPLLALIALVAVPLTLFVTTMIAKRSQPLFVQQWRNTGELNAQVEEAYTGHALVKVFGRHREVEERFTKKNEELFGASFGAQFVSGIIMPATFFIGNLVYVAIAVVGGLMVAAGSLSLGDVQAFIQYSRQFTQPLSQLGAMANLLQSGVASAERVFELLDEPEQSPDPEPAPEPVEQTGRLAFERVSFRYEPEKPLIHDLSLVAEPGHTVAIVGPTGAGKTTLVNLVMRFYDVDAGRITLDGVDIASIPRGELRAQTGMVLQDTWLFEGTIRDNIAYGRPGATEEQILEAATATFVDRFVHSLPDGYDTVIDEEGSNL